ncbi:RHS repeat-associated core domain protein containing protein [Bradyrhizobium sp. YR681]|uniref:RHS repeat-associated core domain-containing protein n=1 Tax=Bradyrhizobium sp. YR681 TaxID=1144344 RepID=UPI0002713177|nr:RHS repeat-associated core domain-containing protein [Bradyrhizobium sp. YR681]EJN15964.1 RHS repeat-associated core domain protein containing protein [Bradyrhizobium sp. YR681]
MGTFGLPPPDIQFNYKSVTGSAVQVLSFDAALAVSSDFDGSVGNSFPVAGFTISLWVNSTQSDANAVVFSYGTQSAGAAQRLWIKNPSDINIGFGAASTGATGLSVADGAWHNITVVVRPVGRAHYEVQVAVDGIVVLINQRALSFVAGTGLPAAGTLVLGSGISGSGETNFRGMMSEFQLWNSALDPPALATILQRQVTSATSGVTLVWALDSAADAGTITGVPSFGASTLTFRESAPGMPAYAWITWTAVSGATDYDVRIVADSGEWTFSQSRILISDLPVGLPGLLLGRSYSAQVRANDSTGKGAWSSSVSMTPIDFAGITLSFQSPNLQTLLAVWPAVDQSTLYQVGLYQNPAQAPVPPPTVAASITTTQYDLSSKLTDSNAWGVLVNASAVGSIGASNMLGSVATPAAGFYYVNPVSTGNGSFTFTLPNARPTPDYFYLRVQQGENHIIDQIIAGTTTSPVEIPSPVPVQAGAQFTGLLRTIGAGVLSPWNSTAITVHKLGAPSPLFEAVASPAPEALQSTWVAVAQGATYDIKLFQDSNPTPIVSLSRQNTLSFALNTYLPAAAALTGSAYTLQVNANDLDETGPPNAIVAPPALQAGFAYTWTGNADTSTLVAGWSASGSYQVYVRVFVGAAQTPSQYGLYTAAQGSAAVPAPPGGFVEGTSYAFQMIGLGTAAMAVPDFGTVIVHNIAAPVVVFAPVAGAVPPAVQAQWAALDPQLETLQYQVVVGGTPMIPMQAGRVYALTAAQLNSAAALSVQVQGVADNSYGLLSPSLPVAPLAPDFSYTQLTPAGGAMTVTWHAAALVYLEVGPSGQTATPVLVSDGTTTSYSVVPPNGGFVEGSVYNNSIKSIANGTVGAFSTLSVTVHILAQPLPVFSAGATAGALTVTWPDIRTPAQQNAGLVVNYIVKLGGTVQGQPGPALTVQVPGVLDQDAAAAVTVQGSADGSFGIVSALPVVATPGGLQVSYDLVSLQFKVTCPAASGALAYWLAITDSGGRSLGTLWTNASSLQNSSIYVGQIATAVAPSGACTVRLRALAAGTVTANANAVITVVNIAGPSIVSPVVQDPPNSTITATWTFDPSAYGLQSASYVAELLNAGGTVLDTKAVSTKSATLSYAGKNVSPGDTVSVRVRAVSGGVSGQWGTLQVAVASSVPQVTITSFCFTSTDAFNLAWSDLGPGFTYTVNMTGTGLKAGVFPKTGLTSTTLSMTSAETGVQNGQTYTATVTGYSGATAGPASVGVSATAGEVTPPDHGGSGGSGTGGDPVNLATGWFSYANADIEVNGVVPLRFVTYYNSYTALPTDDPPQPSVPMGARWNHVYNTLIETAPDGKTLAVMWGAGPINVYDVPQSITGSYRKQGLPNGDRLVCNSDLSYTLTRRDRTVYNFNRDGRLSAILDPAGNAVALAYSNNQLTTITDQASGRSLTLTYWNNGTDNGRIWKVTDNTGRTIVYNYSSGDLVSMTDVQSQPRSYTYWSRSLMKTATDQNGHTFISNRYDSQGRVEFQQDARAIAANAGYGFTFQYADVAGSGGVTYVQTTFTDRMGNVTVYLSDKATQNTVSAVTTLPDNIVYQVTRTFDAFGYMRSETVYQGSPNPAPGTGNTMTCDYDGNGNVAHVNWLTTGESLTLGYDPNNNLTSLTDALGGVTNFDYYPGTNNVHTITYPLGRKTVVTYWPGNIAGQAKTITDYPAAAGGGTSSLGNVTQISYYTNGDLKQIVGPLGNSRTIAYDGDDHGWPVSVTIADSNGTALLQTAITPYPKTGLPNIVAKQYGTQPVANAYATTMVFDFVGNLTSRTNTLLHATTIQRNPGNDPWIITYPAAAGHDPRQTVLLYDNSQNLRSVQLATDPLVMRQYTWDAMARLATMVDGQLQTTNFDYAMDLTHPNGPCPVARTTTTPKVTGEPQPFQSQWVTDMLGRVVKTVDLALQGTSGTVTTVAYSHVTGPTHGVLARQTLVTLPLENSSQQTAYQTIVVTDALGRVISRTAENQKSWTTTYDVVALPIAGSQSQMACEVATTTDPLGNQVIVTTDPLGRVVKRVAGNPGGDGVAAQWRTSSYLYDALNRLLSSQEQVPVAGDTLLPTTYGYNYDAATGYMTVTVSPYGRASSVYSYDGIGQWRSYTDANGLTYGFDYHPDGRLKSYTNGRGKTVLYGFDSAGRFTTTTLPDAGGVITQVLDGNGNRTATKLDQVQVIGRSFDQLNRMTGRTVTATNSTVGYAYWPTGALKTLTHPDGKAVGYVFDGLQRMWTVTDWAARVTTYGYWPMGQLQSAALPNGVSVAYQVDDAGRSTGFVASAAGRTIAASSRILDPFGNPSSETEILPLAPQDEATVQSFTYDADRMLTANGESLTYDDDGNMTGVPGVNGILSYDALNQLTAIGSAASYDYDVDGLLTRTTVNGTVSNLIQDIAGFRAPWLEQADPSRAINAALSVSMPSGPEAPLPLTSGSPGLVGMARGPLNNVIAATDAAGAVQQRYVHGMGLISREDADGNLVYVFDQMGSTLALVDNTGAVTDSYAYSPFGQVLGQTGSTVNPFRYHGRHGALDDGLGLVNMRARRHVPSLLRFSGRDFLFGDDRYGQTLNRYGFVQDNPVALIDPLGLCSDSGGGGLSTGARIALGVIGGLALLIGGAVLIGLLLSGTLGALGGGLGGAVIGGIGGALIGAAVGGVIGAVVGGVIGGVAGGVGGGAGGSSLANNPSEPQYEELNNEDEYGGESGDIPLQTFSSSESSDVSRLQYPLERGKSVNIGSGQVLTHRNPGGSELI